MEKYFNFQFNGKLRDFGMRACVLAAAAVGSCDDGGDGVGSIRDKCHNSVYSLLNEKHPRTWMNAFAAMRSLLPLMAQMPVKRQRTKDRVRRPWPIESVALIPTAFCFDVFHSSSMVFVFVHEKYQNNIIFLWTFEKSKLKLSHEKVMTRTKVYDL